MIPISTSHRDQLLDITSEIQAEVDRSKIKDGLCNIFCLHTSAAILITENYDNGLKLDILDKLKQLIPKGGHRHDQLDGNADSHIKSAIVGPSLTVPIKNGQLLLGQWQGICFAEFSGPREREVEVTVVGS